MSLDSLLNKKKEERELQKQQTLRKEPAKVHTVPQQIKATEIEAKFKHEARPRKPKQRKLIVKIPNFDEIVQFCWDHADRISCQAILIHGLPPRKLRNLPDDTLEELGILDKKRSAVKQFGYWKGRKGGGWRGAILNLLTVLRAMLEE